MKDWAIIIVMRRYWKAVVILLCLLTLAVLGKLVWVEFRVSSDYPDKTFRVSTLMANMFMWKEGYQGMVSQVRVVYTPEKQDRMWVYDGFDNSFVQSVRIKKDGKVLNLKPNYSQDKIDGMIARGDGLEVDFLAYLCLAFEKKVSDPKICYTKAKDFVEFKKSVRLGKIVSVGKKGISWKFGLVKPVYAGCQGTIQCGVYVYTCSCKKNGSTIPGDCEGVSSEGDVCGGTGKCDCTKDCGTSVYPSLSCSSVDDGFCPSVSEDDCANGGECPVNQSCTLVSGGGCTPDCAGKECGDDGCGGSCGTCDSGFTCNNNNKCIADCNCTSPTAPSLSSPASATNYSNYNGSLTLSWNAPSDWGDECSQGYGRRYNVCWGTNAADPCSGGSIQSVTVPTATVNLNTLGTFYWKVVAYNDCNETASSNIWNVVNNSLAKTCALSTGAGLSLVNGIYIGVTGLTGALVRPSGQ